MWQLIIILWVVALSKCDESEWRQVHIRQGDVRGHKDPDGGLYTFYNIPYATVPTGADRFKAPLPPPVWLEPLDAVDKGIICIQSTVPFIDFASKTMQEDCLVANVYAPDTKDKNLPVIVYVHGGAYEIGYGNLLTTKNLVRTKKVIVVNFNYRLGVHGFLCLGTKNAPGNAGLKDQVALLRWVKQNIRSFGGNPDDVTIAGYSAGAVSVDLLMLSKSAEGLFNKVIPESGPGVASIAVQIDPLENAKSFAKTLNFTDVDDFHALEEFYKNTPLKTLQRITLLERKDATVLLSPCVERNDLGAFLVDSPVNIIKNGQYKQVPILIGISNMEGSLQLANIEKNFGAMNEKFADFLPADLQFESEEEKEKVAEKVKEFYFGDQPVGANTILAYVEYFGDITFAYPTLRSVKLHVEAGHDQIYLYEYSFVDDSKPAIPFTEVRRAEHCAQTMAISDSVKTPSVDESSLSEEYKQMKTTIREMWLNFALYGKPVPEGSSLSGWPAAGADGSPYMSFGKQVELREVFLGERGLFWEDIYQKYYREPVAPPQPPPEKRSEL